MVSGPKRLPYVVEDEPKPAELIWKAGVKSFFLRVSLHSNIKGVQKLNANTISLKLFNYCKGNYTFGFFCVAICII